MYLRNLRDSLRRRWYMVVVGMIMVGGLGALTYVEVPPTYEATASVVLLPPSSAVPVGDNPFLYLGGLAQALDVLTRAIDADSTRETVLHGDSALDYTASPDSSSAGPILAVGATGPTEQATLDVLSSVLATIPVTLNQLQEDLSVQTESRISSTIITVDQKATTVGKARIRAVVAVVGAAGTLILLLIGALDGLLLSRRQGEHAAVADESTDADEHEGEDDRQNAAGAVRARGSAASDDEDAAPRQESSPPDEDSPPPDDEGPPPGGDTPGPEGPDSSPTEPDGGDSRDVESPPRAEYADSSTSYALDAPVPDPEDDTSELEHLDEPVPVPAVDHAASVPSPSPDHDGDASAPSRPHASGAHRQVPAAQPAVATAPQAVTEPEAKTKPKARTTAKTTATDRDEPASDEAPAAPPFVIPALVDSDEIPRPYHAHATPGLVDPEELPGLVDHMDELDELSESRPQRSQGWWPWDG